MLAAVATPLGAIVLGPPASHYGYYDSTRSELFEFTARFHAAAELAGERLIAIADPSERSSRNGGDTGAYSELLLRGVPGGDLLDGRLDDVWMRDFFVFQLSDTQVVRFTYAPAYLDAFTVQGINRKTNQLVREIWGPIDPIPLVLDGGSIAWEPSTRCAVLTERVLRDNPWLVNETSLGADGSPPGPAASCCPADPYAGAPVLTVEQLSSGAAALEALLGGVLGADVTVAIVPEEPSAPRLGHIDGIANWLAPGVIALSRYSDDEAYAEVCASRLTSAFGAGLAIVPFAHRPTAAVWEDGFESAAGSSDC